MRYLPKLNSIGNKNQIKTKIYLGTRYNYIRDNNSFMKLYNWNDLRGRAFSCRIENTHFSHKKIMLSL